MLNFSSDFECIGEYDHGERALKEISRNIPDVILMDIDLPAMNGLECTKQIKGNHLTAHVQVIMLTVLEDEYKVLEAIIAGASGYNRPEDIEAVRDVTSRYSFNINKGCAQSHSIIDYNKSRFGYSSFLIVADICNNKKLKK